MIYRASIALQPQSLETSRLAVVEALNELDLAPLVRGAIGVVGIGASHQAAVAGAAALRARLRRAHALHPSDLYDPAVDAADAYVALSASGRSRETVEAVRVRPAVPAFSVSREPGNPLAEVVRAVIPLRSGVDGSPSTTSYTATLQALGLLADRLGDGPAPTNWAAVPDAVGRALSSVAPLAQEAAALLADRREIDFVGAGAALGTAGEAALLVREAVRVPAAANDTFHFLHGPMELLDARMGLVVFGNGREVQLARDVAAFGCPTVLITARSDVAAARGLVVIPIPSLGNGLADAILQILPAQLMVADLSDAASLTDAKFRYRQTDTKLPDKVAA